MAPHLFHLLRPTVYAGTFIHLRSRTELCVREDCILGVDEHGKIEFIKEMRVDEGNGLGWNILSDERIEDEVERLGWGRRRGHWGEDEDSLPGEGEGERAGEKKKEWVLVRAREGEWWFPGFVGELGFLFFLSSLYESLALRRF